MIDQFAFRLSFTAYVFLFVCYDPDFQLKEQIL